MIAYKVVKISLSSIKLVAFNNVIHTFYPTDPKFSIVSYKNYKIHSISALFYLGEPKMLPNFYTIEITISSLF